MLKAILLIRIYKTNTSLKRESLPFPFSSSSTNSVLVKATDIHPFKEKAWNRWESESLLFCTLLCPNRGTAGVQTLNVVLWHRVKWGHTKSCSYTCQRNCQCLKESNPKDFSSHLALLHWDVKCYKKHTHTIKERGSPPPSYYSGHGLSVYSKTLLLSAPQKIPIHSCSQQETKPNMFQVVSGVS